MQPWAWLTELAAARSLTAASLPVSGAAGLCPVGLLLPSMEACMPEVDGSWEESSVAEAAGEEVEAAWEADWAGSWRRRGLNGVGSWGLRVSGSRSKP